MPEGGYYEVELLLDEALYREIELAALADKRSMQSMIRLLVSEALEQRREKVYCDGGLA